jgi:hypothetical protein
MEENNNSTTGTMALGMRAGKGRKALSVCGGRVCFMRRMGETKINISGIRVLLRCQVGLAS